MAKTRRKQKSDAAYVRKALKKDSRKNRKGNREFFRAIRNLTKEQLEEEVEDIEWWEEDEECSSFS